MKKVVMVILLAFMLAGCHAPEEYRMRIIEDKGCTIFIDTETGVCYLDTDTGVTVMLDHNGKPYIANGWRDWGGDDE